MLLLQTLLLRFALMLVFVMFLLLLLLLLLLLQFAELLRSRDPAGVGVPNPLARDLLRKLLAFDPQVLRV